MDILKMKKFRVHYCLISTPEELIKSELRKYFYRFGANENNPHFIEASEKVYSNHNVDHIPIKDRVKTFEFDYDPEVVKFMKIKVRKARRYYKTLKL